MGLYIRMGSDQVVEGEIEPRVEGRENEVFPGKKRNAEIEHRIQGVRKQIG